MKYMMLLCIGFYSSINGKDIQTNCEPLNPPFKWNSSDSLEHLLKVESTTFSWKLKLNVVDREALLAVVIVDAASSELMISCGTSDTLNHKAPYLTSYEPLYIRIKVNGSLLKVGYSNSSNNFMKIGQQSCLEMKDANSISFQGVGELYDADHRVSICVNKEKDVNKLSYIMIYAMIALIVGLISATCICYCKGKKRTNSSSRRPGTPDMVYEEPNTADFWPVSHLSPDAQPPRVAFTQQPNDQVEQSLVLQPCYEVEQDREVSFYGTGNNRNPTCRSSDVQMKIRYKVRTTVSNPLSFHSNLPASRLLMNRVSSPLYENVGVSLPRVTLGGVRPPSEHIYDTPYDDEED